MHSPTRLCSLCEERKTVRGVWYLVTRPGDEPSFFCETCYARSPLAQQGPRGPTRVVDGAPMPDLGQAMPGMPRIE